MNTDWRTRYDAALEAAQQAGQFSPLQHTSIQGIAVEWKADPQSGNDEADRGARRN